MNAMGNDSLAHTPSAGNDDLSAGDLAQLLSGGLRDELGLTSDVLNVGLAIAANHLARGANSEAMRIYVGLVMCEPMNVDFQVGLANCANVMGEQSVALQAASVVIMLAPTDPRGYLLSGRSCIMMGNLDEAREDLHDALKYAGGNEPVVKEIELLLGSIPAQTAG
ncbi:tetratricopeptide repeat protein [Shinella sp.]|uniref:tetratricopeptide repeat protein n=1 Tax=Shinella sp. TaxID=1870904 RepID=UPI004036AEF0